MSFNVLFLDDDANRTKIFLSKVLFADSAENAKDCIGILSKKSFNIVFLDHDLSGEKMVNSDREDCGMEAVRWIVENKPQIDQIIIHSLNYPAAQEMRKKLQDVGYDAVNVPFMMFEARNIYEQIKKKQNKA